MDPLLALERLAGLRARTPHTWYLGLWCRLHPFDPAEVGDLLTDRQAVRIALMRSEVHAVSAADALWLRPLLGPVVARPLGEHAAQLRGVDMGALARAARAIVESEPVTAAALGRRLAQRWPGRDPGALAQAARAQLGLVQVPPRGVWGRSAPALHTTIEKWLAKPLSGAATLERLVMRYLAAFGPATAADCSAWCGLPGLDDVFTRLRPDMATFQTEDGVELLDLPDAPRPDADAEAPVRLLYDHDNLLVAHTDRRRFLRPQDAPPVSDGTGAVLLDGLARGSWTIARTGDTVMTSITRVGRYTKAETAAVEDEAAALLSFVAPTATHDVRVVSA